MMEGALAKIDHAYDLVEGLREDIASGVQNLSFGVQLIHFREDNRLVLFASQPPELFNPIAVRVGEIIHHARSSLDHAIWEMVPNPKPGFTGFPVSTEKGKFSSGKIKGINADAAAIVYGLQPFIDHESDPLWILNELWNRDKHRVLNLCVFSPYGCDVKYRYPDGHFESHPVTYPAEAEHCTVLFSAAHPGDEVEVFYTTAYGPSLSFRDGPATGSIVTDVIFNLVQLSESIIGALLDTGPS